MNNRNTLFVIEWQSDQVVTPKRNCLTKTESQRVIQISSTVNHGKRRVDFLLDEGSSEHQQPSKITECRTFWLLESRSDWNRSRRESSNGTIVNESRRVLYRWPKGFSLVRSLPKPLLVGSNFGVRQILDYRLYCRVMKKV